MAKSQTSQPLSHSLWDWFCLASIIGIWPRYIEPKLVFTTNLKLPIPNLPKALHNLRILQISDLHLHNGMSDAFMQKVANKIQAYHPDIITCTGDFLCHGLLKAPERLRHWLQKLQAPYGCYAVLGNHDYAGYIAINAQGEYDLLPAPSSTVFSGFKRLRPSCKLTKTTTTRARQVPLNRELLALLNDTPFKLLHNNTLTVPIKGSKLNISGLGEYMQGSCDPQAAFKNYDTDYPGIVLLHNPDGFSLLKNTPGDVVLCGHTHGGQINLPWLWKKFTRIENLQYKQGLFKVDGKWLYVNRGIGSVLPLRCFSPPEILLCTLEQAS